MPLPTFGARFGVASLWRGQAPRATRLHSGELSERALGVAMLAPMVLVLLLVVAYPLADSLWLSLHRVNLPIPSRASRSSAWAITSTPSDSRRSGIPCTAPSTLRSSPWRWS